MTSPRNSRTCRGRARVADYRRRGQAPSLCAGPIGRGRTPDRARAPIGVPPEPRWRSWDAAEPVDLRQVARHAQHLTTGGVAFDRRETTLPEVLLDNPDMVGLAPVP